MTKPISRYPVFEINEVSDEIKEIYKAIEEHFGFIPNVVKALAYRPEELKAFMAYNNAVMGKKSGLTPAEKEMLIIAHSNYNGCTYCVLSHGAALRKTGENPNLVEQIAINYHEADITPRQKAMIDFAMKVTTNSREINEKDFEILEGHGFSREDIWDIASITSFFNMSNRMMNFAKIRPDDKLYTLGR